MVKKMLYIIVLIAIGTGGYFYGTADRSRLVEFEWVGECASYMHEVECDGRVYVIPIPDGENLERYAAEYCEYIETLER